MVIIKSGVVTGRTAAVVVCSTLETSGTLTDLVATVIVVIGLAPKALVAMAGFITIIIVMIHATEKGFAAGASFLSACVKMIISAPEVFSGFADLFAVCVIVKCFSEKAFPAVSVLCHTETT